MYITHSTPDECVAVMHRCTSQYFHTLQNNLLFIARLNGFNAISPERYCFASWAVKTQGNLQFALDYYCKVASKFQIEPCINLIMTIMKLIRTLPAGEVIFNGVNPHQECINEIKHNLSFFKGNQKIMEEELFLSRS